MGDGLNLYAYVYGNPNVLIDPYGLCAVQKSFTLQGQSNFWAGFGDFLSSGFGLSYLFGIPSFTEWARIQTGADFVVERNSILYSTGAIAGNFVAGSIVGGLAVNAGKAGIAALIKYSNTISGFASGSVGGYISSEGDLASAVTGGILGAAFAYRFPVDRLNIMTKSIGSFATNITTSSLGQVIGNVVTYLKTDSKNHNWNFSPEAALFAGAGGAISKFYKFTGFSKATQVLMEGFTIGGLEWVGSKI